MCGICGLLEGNRAREVDVSAVERMNDALRHRGPDDSGVWHAPGVAIAARRLSIIDVEHGHQPMQTEDGAYVVVFNGEIYNAAEVREALEAKGRRFRTRCDTEVVLEAFAEYGEECLHRFNGMFAFAVYDTARRRLFLARDRLGIKPLYYTIVNGALAFSSELDSLLRSGLVGGRLNADAVDAYFAYLYVPAPLCIFAGVKKLEPGCWVSFEADSLRSERYWRPEFSVDGTWTLDSAAERFLDLLRDSLRLRQISDVPLGAFLSGGIDSSAVVALLSEVSDAPVNTFSIGFDDAAANELPYARAVAERYGTVHRAEVMTPDPVAMLPELVRHFGEPFADSSAVPTWMVSKLAREHVTVALSGDGGDELFAGYSWLHMNRRVARYRRVPESLRRLLGVLLHVAPESPLVEKFRRFNGDSFVDDRASFRRRQLCFSDEARGTLYSPALRDGIEIEASKQFYESADAEESMSEDEWMLAQDMGMYLPDDILTKVDRMSMAASLEARVPLLDHRMVEFAGTVPFALKYAGGESKRLVKHALRNLLPAENLRQRKRGFSIPVQRWMRDELRGSFEEQVLGGDSLSGEFVDGAVVRGVFDAHVSGKQDNGHRLWALLAFEQWLRYVEEIPGVRVSL